MKPDGYFDLYYLFKVLDLNGIKRRDNRIAKIHIAFETINIKREYKHPFYDAENPNKLKKSDEDYKFHYKTTVQEIVKEAVEKALSDDELNEINDLISKSLIAEETECFDEYDSSEINEILVNAYS